MVVPTETDDETVIQIAPFRIDLQAVKMPNDARTQLKDRSKTNSFLIFATC